MASKTRLQFIHQGVANLGVLVPGQSPSPEDIDKIDNILDPILASLAARDIVYVADTGTSNPPDGGEFDDSIFLGTAHLVTDPCAPMFNMAGDPQLRANAIQAEDELRVIGRPTRTRKTLQCDAAVQSQYASVMGNFTRGT